MRILDGYLDRMCNSKFTIRGASFISITFYHVNENLVNIAVTQDKDFLYNF